MPRVVHVEIQAENTERAITFYPKTFDWMFEKFPGEIRYWLAITGPKEEPGIDGGNPIDNGAVNCSVCTIKVGNVDESVSTAVTNGAVNVVPKLAIAGVGWLAYCKDTEGNIFGVMQEDRNAKYEGF